MEHDKLVHMIRSVIENRQDTTMSLDSEDYDLHSIATEAHEETLAAGVDELDVESYWQIIEKHAKA